MRIGRTLSEETKQKLREAQLRRWSDPERRRNQSEKHTGKIVSEETRERMSKARTGMKYNTKKRRGAEGASNEK